MTWLNEYEIDDAVRRFDPDEAPNLATAAFALRELMQWTNRNSDGWPYWAPPSKASEKLQSLIARADRFSPVDITAADLAGAVRPIKAFRTKVNKGGSWGMRAGCADFRLPGDPPPPSAGPGQVAVTYIFVVNAEDRDSTASVTTAVEEYIHSTPGALDSPVKVEVLDG